MKRELNVDNYIKFMTDEELLVWENIYNTDLSIKINDEVSKQIISKDYLDKFQNIASENLKKIKEEQLQRSKQI